MCEFKRRKNDKNRISQFFILMLNVLIIFNKVVYISIYVCTFNIYIELFFTFIAIFGSFNNKNKSVQQVIRWFSRSLSRFHLFLLWRRLSLFMCHVLKYSVAAYHFTIQDDQLSSTTNGRKKKLKIYSFTRNKITHSTTEIVEKNSPRVRSCVNKSSIFFC